MVILHFYLKNHKSWLKFSQITYPQSSPVLWLSLLRSHPSWLKTKAIYCSHIHISSSAVPLTSDSSTQLPTWHFLWEVTSERPNISKTKFLVSPSNLLLWVFLTLVSNMAASFLAFFKSKILAPFLLLLSHIPHPIHQHILLALFKVFSESDHLLPLPSF